MNEMTGEQNSLIWITFVLVGFPLFKITSGVFTITKYRHRSFAKLENKLFLPKIFNRPCADEGTSKSLSLEIILLMLFSSYVRFLV